MGRFQSANHEAQEGPNSCPPPPAKQTNRQKQSPESTHRRLVGVNAPNFQNKAAEELRTLNQKIELSCHSDGGALGSEIEFRKQAEGINIGKKIEKNLGGGVLSGLEVEKRRHQQNLAFGNQDVGDVVIAPTSPQKCGTGKKRNKKLPNIPSAGELFQIASYCDPKKRFIFPTKYNAPPHIKPL